MVSARGSRLLFQMHCLTLTVPSHFPSTLTPCSLSVFGVLKGNPGVFTCSHSWQQTSWGGRILLRQLWLYRPGHDQIQQGGASRGHDPKGQWTPTRCSGDGHQGSWYQQGANFSLTSGLQRQGAKAANEAWLEGKAGKHVAVGAAVGWQPEQ